MQGIPKNRREAHFSLPAAPGVSGTEPAAPALDALRAERPSGEPELHVPARTAACRLPAGVRRLRRGLCTGSAFAGLRCCVARRISRPVSVCARRRGAMHAEFRCAVTKTAAGRHRIHRKANGGLFHVRTEKAAAGAPCGGAARAHRDARACAERSSRPTTSLTTSPIPC